MKLTSASVSLSLLALAVIASSSAVAGDLTWYIGGNIGQAKAKIDDERIANDLLGAGLTTTSMAKDEREFGYKIFGGVGFLKYFALEGGYFDLGEFGFTATTSPPGTLSGDMTLKGLFLDDLLILPITERLSAFGRFGLNYAETKSSYTATGSASAPRNGKVRELDYKFGLGLQYDFTKVLGMRLEAERNRIDDAVGNKADIDLFSLGLVLRFPAKAPAPAPRAAAPPPPAPRVAAAPVPVPVPVVVPAPVKTEQYCSILDIAFEINKDVIQREEKERLAVVGTFLKKYPDTTAVIEGHSDDVGTDEFNLKLSQQRADSVVSYLVDELHIAPSRLTAVGYGESRPIASNSTNEGKQKNRRINAVISCARDIEGLTVVPARVTLAMEMEFDPKSAEIEPQYRDNLAYVANYMKAYPAITATVEGHANKFLGLGSKQVEVTPEAAMEVSKRRAQNVVNYLVDHFGIARSRLAAEGFGQTRRVTYGNTKAEQKDNRRVNIIFNYPKK